jgi:hypothetical protein
MAHATIPKHNARNPYKNAKSIEPRKAENREDIRNIIAKAIRKKQIPTVISS